MSESILVTTILNPLIKSVIDVWGWYVGLLVSAAGVILRKWLGKWVVHYAEIIVKKYSTPPPIIKDSSGTSIGPTVLRDIKLYDTIADLRKDIGCDRAYIMQFANGSSFSSKTPIWKLNRTHETANPNIRLFASEVDGTASSRITDLIFPFWETNLSCRSGITKISPAYCGCPGREQCSFPNGIYLYDVDKMNEGYSKGLLMSHSVKYLVTTPLFNTTLGCVGYIGVEYCWDDVQLDNITKHAEEICRVGSIISVELENKPRPPTITTAPVSPTP